MSNRIKTFIFFILIYLLTFASIGQNYHWTKSFGSKKGDGGYFTKTDKYGNIFVVGVFSDTMEVQTKSGMVRLIKENYNYDIFVMKIDSSGNVDWAKRIGGTGSVNLSSIDVDREDNLLIVGNFAGTMDTNPDPLITNNLTSIMFSNCFIIKINTNGSLVWSAMYGGTVGPKHSSVHADKNNNIYICGSYSHNGFSDFNPGLGLAPGVYITYLNPSNSYDAYLMKLSPSGVFQWVKGFGGNLEDNAVHLTSDSLNNLYIIGQFKYNCDFDPGPQTHTLTPHGIEDVFVSKLDSMGNFIWAKSFGGPSIDYVTSVKLDKSCNVYVGGCHMGTSYITQGNTTTTITSLGYTDAYVFKLNSQGSFCWLKSIGSIGHEEVHAIDLDSYANLYIIGIFTKGTTDFDPGSGIFNLTSTSLFCSYISKLDSSGNFISAKCLSNYDTTGRSFYNSLTIDKLDNIYLTGSFDKPVDFDIDQGIHTIGSIGMADVFVSKLGKCKQELKIISDTVICSGESTTIKVFGGSSYTWNPNVTSNSSYSFTPYQSTSFTITGVKSSDCTGESVFSLSLSECTSISEKTTEVKTIRLFPNPTSNNLYIQSDSELSLNLSNLTGQVLYKFSLSSINNFKTSINGLVPGVYIITGSGIKEKIIVLE